MPEPGSWLNPILGTLADESSIAGDAIQAWCIAVLSVLRSRQVKIDRQTIRWS
jgi:hypothetical protein